MYDIILFTDYIKANPHICLILYFLYLLFIVIILIIAIKHKPKKINNKEIKDTPEDTDTSEDTDTTEDTDTIEDTETSEDIETSEDTDTKSKNLNKVLKLIEKLNASELQCILEKYTERFLIPNWYTKSDLEELSNIKISDNIWNQILSSNYLSEEVNKICIQLVNSKYNKADEDNEDNEADKADEVNESDEADEIDK